MEAGGETGIESDEDEDEEEDNPGTTPIRMRHLSTTHHSVIGFLLFLPLYSLGEDNLG